MSEIINIIEQNAAKYKRFSGKNIYEILKEFPGFMRRRNTNMKIEEIKDKEELIKECKKIGAMSILSLSLTLNELRQDPSSFFNLEISS